MCGYSEKSDLRKIYTIECIYQKEEKTKINNLTFQILEKEQKIKSKERTRRKIIKISAALNQTEYRKTIEK